MLFHDSELAEQARRMGFAPIILPSKNRFLYTTAKTIARTLQRQQIGVVHVHGYKATVLCALARRWHRFGIVKTEHGLPEPMGGRPLQMMRDRLYHALDWLAVRSSRATVCYVTDELRRQYEGDRPGAAYTVIPNGVATMERTHYRRPPELPNDSFNVAVLGRLEDVKGQNLAIKAVSHPAMPPDVHLHIVGAGPTEASLRLLAEHCGISARVHFLGFRRNAYDFLAHCDVLLIPSLHEGLPYTLLEGMALATPIIASRVGGLAEVLREGGGLLISPGDTDSIAEAVVKLRNTPLLCRQLSERARQVQQEYYSVDVMASRYASIFRSVVSE
jgi:L-malate glycosyltransferase